MLQYLGLVFWIGFAVLVGVTARKRNRSLVGWLLLALLISPVLAIILLLIFPPALSGLPTAPAANPKAQKTARSGANSEVAKRSRAPQQSNSPDRAVAPRVLVGLGVLALAILAPAVWYSTSLHASSGTHSMVVAHSLSALTGRSASSLPPVAWLWCPECGEEGMPVNLWQKTGTDRGSAVTSAPHGTAVIPARETQGNDGRTWYYVTMDGESGYVPSSLITFTDPALSAEPKPAAVPTPAEAPASGEGIVSVSANLRAGPGTEYTATGGLDAGAAIQIVGQDDAGDWYQLVGGDWIAAFLVIRTAESRQSETVSVTKSTPLSFTDVNPPKVNVQNANLRSGPGTEFAVVGNLFADQELKAVGVNAAGDWYQLADGRWIYAELVSHPPPGLPVITNAAPQP